MKDNDHRLQIAATTHRINFVVAKYNSPIIPKVVFEKTTKIQWCSNTTFLLRVMGKC